MHVRFAAQVPHHNGTETRFLALDKPLPRRQFLDVIEIDARSECRKLCYDRCWLAILNITDSLTNVENRVCCLSFCQYYYLFQSCYMPGPGGPDGERYDFRPTEDEMKHVDSIFDDLIIPMNFRRTAPMHHPNDTIRNVRTSLYYRFILNTPFTLFYSEILNRTNSAQSSAFAI